MKYRWQTYLIPQTLKEALDQLDANCENARIIAGGTDLIVALEKQDAFVPTVIDISGIPELSRIVVEENQIKIGAGVTLSEIEKSPVIQKHAPFLVTAIRTIGSVQIRNLATLVGNIGNASPAADGVLSLLTLNSRVSLVNKTGEREIPLSSFLIGPGRTALNPGEIIQQVSFPLPVDGVLGSFQKLGLRKAMHIAVTNVSVVAQVVDEIVVDARIALGAVGPTAVRVAPAERAMVGQPINPTVIDEVCELCVQNSSPIDDIRASFAYRKKMVRALSKRCLNDIHDQITCSKSQEI